jgi:hypothetical protein
MLTHVLKSLSVLFLQPSLLQCSVDDIVSGLVSIYRKGEIDRCLASVHQALVGTFEYFLIKFPQRCRITG